MKFKKRIGRQFLKNRKGGGFYFRINPRFHQSKDRLNLIEFSGV